MAELIIWASIIAILACGVLSIAPKIVAKSPNAKPMLDNLAKFGGVIGLVALGLGVYHLIDKFKFLGDMFKSLSGLTLIAGIACLIILGFLLGWGLFATMAFKPGTPAAAKGEAMRAKLATIQGLAGIVAVVVGIVWLLFQLKILTP